MRLSDYSSSNTTLQRQNLDKWNAFAQVTPTSVPLQGWKSGQTTLKASVVLPSAGSFSLNGASLNLALLSTTGVTTLNGNSFTGIGAGDLVTFTLNAGNTTPAISGTAVITLEVAQVNLADGTNRSSLTFVQTATQASILIGNQLTPTTPVVAATVFATGQTVVVSQVLATDATATVGYQTQTIDSITISAHGIPIYNGFSSKFFNAYIPYHYGGSNIKVSEDIGAYMIPFNLYPGGNV